MPDVVVVGSGIIGLSVAYELARRGARVTVLDARAPGLGATQASAGVLAPFIEAPARTPLQILGIESLGLYDEFIARVSRDARIEVEYQRNGTLEVALDEDEADHLRTAAGLLESMGVPVELLEGAALFRREPLIAPAAQAALFIPQHGFVSAPGLVRALVRASEVHGVTHRTGSRATRVERQGERLSVQIGSGPAAEPGGGAAATTGVSVSQDSAASQDSPARESVAADAVVLAAGSWSGLIECEASAVPVRPVRGQLLHLAWTAAPLARVTWGARCYMVPWADGTVLLGATVEEAGFAEDVTVAGIRTLLDAACELVPQTVSAGFREARVGLRPATTDTLPIIGPSAEMPGLFHASGHYRNGILLTPLTAIMLADGILEGRWHTLLDATSPARFHARDVFRAPA